ncbi:pyridoxal phosphate-dependent aminotransferase [Senegalia massiliensis]|uniref:Pyridoxal phosphate-dependent aminotransferase n=1 Tax=Senegalia massiliensis TaxID=1720316 RepID=A0A845QZ76_9CLOT|nr:pyridoxal phosphate-dependent aminotransferase [Senegalia massiliensis]NBI07785.1 pyridoxal phosphate-dependent aminotransferase [Senegalia massiliensis]
MKHKFIAKRYWKDITTPMGQSDVLAASFDDVINLSLGDPDLITDDLIIDNSMKDAKAGHTKYTDFRGDPELRKEIIKTYKKDYNIDFKDEEIMVVASGCLAMYLVLEAIIDDGDEVIIHSPFFTPYPQQVELARGIPVFLDTLEEEDFQINIERLESLITERTKALIINTPNNPTGTCFTRSTLEDIAYIAKKYDLVIISDEIYGAYSYQNPFIPMVTIDDMKERTITINSFSKDYTMTGWRIGHVLAPDYIIKTIQQINENVVFTAPSISQRGAIYALRNREKIQPPMIKEYRDRIFYAYERINKIPNMSVLSPKGTFYLFVNIKETGLSSTEVSDRILKKAHVLVLPGIAFGEAGEGYVRIACTVGIEKLKEAFDRIEKMKLFQN